MLPVLFSLGPFKIYSMGVLLSAGIFIGLFYWWKLGKDEHWDDIALFDAFFLALVSFLVFGRLGYVGMHWSELGTLYRIIAFLTYPGLSYIFGLAGAVFSVISFARAREWNAWKVMDVIAIVVPLILVFGFAGALLNGSNPGRESAFGLVFPGAEGRRFPVDIWGMIWALITFGMTVKIRKNFRFYDWYKGSASVVKDGLAALAMLGSAGIYLIIRGFIDDGLTSLGPISVVAIAGLVVTILSSVIIYRRAGNIEKLFRRKS